MTHGGPEGRRPEPGMWQEFRRRRVTRTVFLYLALMFLAVEAYLLAASFVVLPPWGLRAVVGVAVLGFPLAVVLAWSYDVTPSGIVKTPEDLGHESPSAPERSRAWLFVVAGAVVLGLVLRIVRP